MNSDMVINKKNKKKKKKLKFSSLQFTVFLLKFLGIVFVEILLAETDFVGAVFLATIISPHVVITSSIIRSNYLSFLKTYVLELQM